MEGTASSISNVTFTLRNTRYADENNLCINIISQVNILQILGIYSHSWTRQVYIYSSLKPQGRNIGCFKSIMYYVRSKHAQPTEKKCCATFFRSLPTAAKFKKGTLDVTQENLSTLMRDCFKKIIHRTFICTEWIIIAFLLQCLNIKLNFPK